MLQLFRPSYLLLVLPEIGRFPEVSACFLTKGGTCTGKFEDDGHENVKKRKTFGEREKFRLSIGLTYYKIGGRIIPWRSVNMGRRKEWIPMSQIRYKRILLKLSGEALAGGQHRGLDFDTIGRV